MNYFVVLFCFASLTAAHKLSDDVLEMAKMLHDKCAGETGVNEALIPLAQKGEFQPDPKLKCYIKCIMETTGAMSEDGTVDVETMISILPEELKAIISPTIRKCGTQRGSDPCDTAFLTHKCYYANDAEHYFIV